MVRNLSFPASGDPIALVYLSANSQAVTKSTQSVPKTARQYSLFLGFSGIGAILQLMMVYYLVESQHMT